MKNKDWLIVKCPYFPNNPIIINKSAITLITPVNNDQLKSFIYLKDRDAAIVVDEPSSTIEGYL